MDCPICQRQFPANQIQSHVESCLIEQDAAAARKIHQEINKPLAHHEPTGYAQHPPANAASGAFPKNQTQAVSGRPATAIPRYGPVSISTPPVYAPAPKNTQQQRPLPPQSAAQNPNRSQVGSSVTGAVQADVDGYNNKIGLAHKQLTLLHDSLESFAHRISLLEMRKHERIVPPVELGSMPPPRYMAIKGPQSQQQQQQNTKGLHPTPHTHMHHLHGSQPPSQQDKRNRFFESAQRFYNDKTGANMFFAGAAKPSSPLPKQLPSSTTSPYHIPPTTQPQAPAIPSKPVPGPKPVPQPETGITDIHVAQIESKWINTILQFPDDAEDLILGHLTMLFNQKIKRKKNVSSEADEGSNAASAHDQSSQNSSSVSNGGKSEVTITPGVNKLAVSADSGMSHPVSEFVSTMIETWNEPFLKIHEPTQETLQTAVATINGLIATLEDVVLDYYKELTVSNIPRSATRQHYAAAEHREQLLRDGVRTAIWPLFYNDMLSLIHAKVSAEEDVCNQKMKEYMTMNPAHLGIPRDYWLIEMADSNAEGKTWSMPPYYLAIQTFKELPVLKTPEAKLKCVVKSARDLVKCVASFHSFFGRNPDKYPVGGDELLPIFTYVVIRSGVKNLISEATFMELFANDDQARGEMGYILATLQTVIAFLSCLDNTSISQSVDSVFKSIAVEIGQLKDAPSESIPPPTAQNQAHGQESKPIVSRSEHDVGNAAPPQNHAVPHSLQIPHAAAPEKNGHSQTDDFEHGSIELQPIGVQKGSFFAEDSSLDTFDDSNITTQDLSSSFHPNMTEMVEINKH